MIHSSFTNTDTKKLALLIDPDKHDNNSLASISKKAETLNVQYIFVGGSLLMANIENTITQIKKQYNGPVILFPGNACQVSANADGILFLSLISGRNAEFLIGNHVISAPVIKQTKLEVIPTGYILIDGGNKTSVEYMSNTSPIPAQKPDIAIATAIAGEMLGLKCLYLEGGSGAKNIIPEKLIEGVKQNVSIPIIVGGGIRSAESLQTVFNAGADIAVVGTIIEENSTILDEMMMVVNSY